MMEQEEIEKQIFEKMKTKGFGESMCNETKRDVLRWVMQQLRKTNVSNRFSKEDLWDAWWASAIKTISFSGVDKEYERRCFEKFYANKLSPSNGG